VSPALCHQPTTLDRRAVRVAELDAGLAAALDLSLAS
jgi:hypothetical protein